MIDPRFADPRFDHIPDSNLRECLIYAENECDSLRRILAWCGPRLSPADRAQVAKMVREKVLKDGREEDREELIEAGNLLVKFAELVREIVGGEPIPLDWFTRADSLAGRAMEYDPPSHEATLVELRNFKELRTAAGLP